MTAKLVCDRCGATYTDKESIDDALKLKDGWAELCKCDGVEPRGIAPCPNIRCEGEMIMGNHD